MLIFHKKNPVISVENGTITPSHLPRPAGFEHVVCSFLDKKCAHTDTQLNDLMNEKRKKRRVIIIGKGNI